MNQACPCLSSLNVVLESVKILQDIFNTVSGFTNCLVFNQLVLQTVWCLNKCV